jgi:uncharacterized BrkB/YihY/UPF0761 family membrane protein
MNENDRHRFTSSKKVILFFAVIFVVVSLYLFYPIVECIHDWSGYAEDCSETFALTIIIPYPIFLVIWFVLFMGSLLLVKAKQNK